jgi:hypothetical protein
MIVPPVLCSASSVVQIDGILGHIYQTTLLSNDFSKSVPRRLQQVLIRWHLKSVTPRSVDCSNARQRREGGIQIHYKII